MYLLSADALSYLDSETCSPRRLDLQESTNQGGKIFQSK